MAISIPRRELFIDGEWKEPATMKRIPIINPSTEGVVGDIPAATAEDVELAVAAAQKAFLRNNGQDWPHTSGAYRAKYLRAIASKITERKSDLAKLEAIDCGKPLDEAAWDMDDVAACFEYYADLAEALDNKQKAPLSLPLETFRGHALKEPLGVVGLITPWNYPLLMATWKVAPALAAGCTAILKPSELASVTCLELGEVCREVRLPPGVLNILSGLGPEAGGPLASHPKVDKIAFTGSTATGSMIMSAAAKVVKPVSLELGGKSPILIFDDVELDKGFGSGQHFGKEPTTNIPSVFVAIYMNTQWWCFYLKQRAKQCFIIISQKLLERVKPLKTSLLGSKSAAEWAVFGCFWTNGQICSATSRLLVHQNIAEEFVLKLVSWTRNIKISDPLEEGCRLGPVVSEGQYMKVMNFISTAKREGATILCGGTRPQHLKKGFFVEPTIITGVETSMQIWREEVFGPVLCVKTFRTEEEAIELANDTQYGLAGAVLSKDLERCERVTKALQAGIVWVNCSQPCFCQAPWGGTKRSGFGRELGEWGLDNYLNVKQVTEYISNEPWGWYPSPSKL